MFALVKINAFKVYRGKKNRFRLQSEYRNDGIKKKQLDMVEFYVTYSNFK